MNPISHYGEVKVFEATPKKEELLKTKNEKYRGSFSMFWQNLKSAICPYCGCPMIRVVKVGQHVCSKPCGCYLFGATRNPIKFVKLDEFRAARAAYKQIKKENPMFRMPFWIYFDFMSQRKKYVMQRRTHTQAGGSL